MSTEPSFRGASFARDNLGLHIPHSIVEQFSDAGNSDDKKVVDEIDARHVKQFRTLDRFSAAGLCIVRNAAMKWKTGGTLHLKQSCEYRRNDYVNPAFHLQLRTVHLMEIVGRRHKRYVIGRLFDFM